MSETRAPIRTDIAVGGRLLPPRRSGVAPSSAQNATLVARRDLTPAVARLTVRPDGGVPTFEAGQYFALGLPVEGRVLQRPYSTASAPGTGDGLEFLVRLVPGGAFTPRLWALRPGDRLRIGSPKGRFTLRPGDERTHLFISTGTGLAPFIAMAHTLRARRGRPPAIVVHGVADVAELAYRECLEGWAADDPWIAYRPSISRPGRPVNTGWTGATGRIDAVLPAMLDAVRIDPSAAVAYVCGNPGMIATVSRQLRDRGLPGDAIVSEHYWTDGDAGRPG